MLRLRQDAGFRAHYIPRSQRALPEVLSEPAERSDCGKRIRQARPRLHPLSPFWKDPKGLAQGNRIHLKQNLSGQSRHLNGRPGWFRLPEEFPIHLIEPREMFQVS